MPLGIVLSDRFVLKSRLHGLFYNCRLSGCKGVYPQSDGSLAIVNIDASKGFVDLWVHLSFVIFVISDLKRQLELLEMAFDQVQTCLIFPFRWAHFPIKYSRN